jgi:cell wall-associated NlpC family hydrolase
MRFTTTAVARCARLGLAAAAVAAFATAALAAPDETLDPVTQLLVDKGLIEVPAAPVPLLRRVRDHAAEMRARAADRVLTALNFVGVSYRRGGSSEDAGFDCSGFTRYVFGNSIGLVLPRRADEQAGAPGLVAVKREDLQPGDLVFFNTLKRTFSHVGIYIGDNRFVHAPRPGGQVRTEDMGYAYWKQRFTGARRADPAVASATAADAASATLP